MASDTKSGIEADVLTDAVASLTLAPASTQPVEETFVGVKKALNAFSTIRDFGTYVWKPGSPSRDELKSHGEATANDILHRIDAGNNPTDVPVLNLKNVRLPVKFLTSRTQFLTNRFPNDAGVAASIAAATSRGLNLDDVDFIFGGSTLSMLSERSTAGNVYLVQRVGQTIAVGKHSEYTSDLMARGFQFERLVTGEKMAAHASENRVLSMQLALVGDFRVFFHAELDAVDVDGTRVEIKSGNPAMFGAKQMFQMVASRSRSLVFAKCQGNRVCGIEKRSIEEVASWVSREKRLVLQQNLLDTMLEIKDLAASIGEDEPSQLLFRDGHVELRPRPDVALLPPRGVVASIVACKYTEDLGFHCSDSASESESEDEDAPGRYNK